MKDDVENPNAPLKNGVIRLAAGGGLFDLAIVYEAMVNTISDNVNAQQAATLNKVSFAIA